MANKLYTYLVVLWLVALAVQQCQPYYPRMFWNPNADEIDTHIIDMIFMFNTNVTCPYSYVQIYDHSSIYKFRCGETKIETKFDNGTIEFNTFVQKCFVYVVKDAEIEQFKYRLFGSKFITTLEAEPSE